MSELPKEKVLRAWSPLRDAFDKQAELHAEAAKELDRLFPKGNAGSGLEVTDEAEPEPNPEQGEADFEGEGEGWDGVFSFGLNL